MLLNTYWTTHVPLMLATLRQLPVYSQAKFKVLVINYKGLGGLCPGYLKDRLTSIWPCFVFPLTENNRILVLCQREPLKVL